MALVLSAIDVRIRRALVFVLFGVCATASFASATDFRVDTSSDGPDHVPDGRCATAEGLCTLRAAVMEASRSEGDAHVIIIPPGIYRLESHREEDGGREGDLDIRVDALGKHLTIRGAGPPAAYCAGVCGPVDPTGSTVIDGSGTNDRVLDIWWYATVVIEDLAITGGNLYPLLSGTPTCLIGISGFPAIVTNDVCNTAGAIRSRGALTLRNVAIYQNNATFGGGIDSSGPLTLDRVAVIGNRTHSTAVFVDGNRIWRPWFCGGGIRHQSGPLGGNLDDSRTCPSDEDAHVVGRNAGLDPYLRDNGGPTKTHALQAGSIAIDRVAAGDCVAASGARLRFDQRGARRPADAGCDTGAFERGLLLTMPKAVCCTRVLEGIGRSMFVMLDGARLMLAEMMSENDPNVDPAGTMIQELELASQKLDAFAETSDPGQWIDVADDLAAQLSRAEQVRLSFDAHVSGMSGVRWKSLGHLGSRAQEQVAALKSALIRVRR